MPLPSGRNPAPKAADTSDLGAPQNLAAVILRSAERGLCQQAADGAMPAGHNGPWRMPETPARASAHWAITFAHAFGLDGRPVWRDAALRAADSVLRCRTTSGFFHCLHGRRPTNGLIGQAWVVEALVEVGVRLQRPDLLAIARQTAHLHPFDATLGLWQRVDLAARPRGIERTANQQIWWAAMTARVARETSDTELAARAARFVERLPAHLACAGPLVLHFVRTRASDRLLLAVLRRAPRIVPGRDFARLNRGYASFLLAGLALLARDSPQPLPQPVPTLAANLLGYLEDELFPAPDQLAAAADDFAWAYNPTGIEAALALRWLELPRRISAEQWLAEQWRRHLGDELMDRATTDPSILAARLYEAAGLLDGS